jgi:transposase-like protein
MKKQKNKLTPKQREEIIRLRFEEHMTLRSIAEKFGVTTQNISYYIRLHKDKAAREAKKPKPKTLEQTLDPIQFRIEKLQEVALDIQIARDEKVIHSLPTYHKLHISIHNELREMVSASKDIQSLDSENLKREIIDTIANLPPILRTQIIRELEESNLPNVVRLKTQ